MGSIDLSIGSTVSMVGMLPALFIRDHGEWAVLAAPLAGAATARSAACSPLRPGYPRFSSRLASRSPLTACPFTSRKAPSRSGLSRTFRSNQSSTDFCLGRRPSRPVRRGLGCYRSSQRAEPGSEATFTQSTAARPWPSSAASGSPVHSFTPSLFAGFSPDSPLSCLCCV